MAFGSEPRCGVDEAGRGPLAGPVFAGAVILDPARIIPGLADSKQIPERRRLELADRIRSESLAWAVACASVEEIDRLNILGATLLAMKRAVESLGVMPGAALIDGVHCPALGMPTRALPRGDSLIPAISAASILAKTARDSVMLELHDRYPQYDFARHKGYPTAAHLAALRTWGASPVHRRSFAPVRAVL